GRLVQHPGRVADDDPQPARGTEVDVVVSHRDVGDDLKAAAARLEYLLVNVVGERTHDRVGISREPDEVNVRAPARADDLVAGAQEGRLAAGWEWRCHEYAGLLSHGAATFRSGRH